MRKHSKLILASLTAALLMAIAVSGTASARVFSLTNRNFRVVWVSLEFINNTGFGTIRCPVTLEGSFHSQTISKVEKALIGHVSRATIAEASCSGGRATVQPGSLPWHLTYSGFRGILPRINSIRYLLFRPEFQIRTPLLAGTCTITAGTEHQARGEAVLNEMGEIQNLVPDSSIQIPAIGCELTEVMLRASATDGKITLLGNTTRIRVTLI